MNMGAATRKTHEEVDNGDGHSLMFLTIATKISVNIFTSGISGVAQDETDGKRIRWCAGGSAHVRFAVYIR
jgi:hypothetical protein